MKVYSRKGDKGKTFLFMGGEVAKDNLRIACLGDLDELNSFLGLAKATVKSPVLKRIINILQQDIFIISSEVATEARNLKRLRVRFDYKRLSWVEKQIDKLSASIKFKNCSFFVPGENFASALFDVCRAICRRAERSAVSFNGRIGINNPAIIPYLNRLSSLLFALARQSERRQRIFLSR